jgi:hypothetical protein
LSTSDDRNGGTLAKKELKVEQGFSTLYEGVANSIYTVLDKKKTCGSMVVWLAGKRLGGKTTLPRGANDGRTLPRI